MVWGGVLGDARHVLSPEEPQLPLFENGNADPHPKGFLGGSRGRGNHQRVVGALCTGTGAGWLSCRGSPLLSAPPARRCGGRDRVCAPRAWGHPGIHTLSLFQL